MNRNIFLALSATLAIACSDDAGDDPAPAQAGFELSGEWATEAGGFAGTASITDTTWKDYTNLIVVSFDNAKNIAITQNPPDAKDGIKPNLYSKTVWTEPVGGVTYVCVVDYDLATKEAALATTKTADAKDPGKSGCGTFAWTKMTKK